MPGCCECRRVFITLKSILDEELLFFFKKLRIPTSVTGYLIFNVCVLIIAAFFFLSAGVCCTNLPYFDCTDS